MHDLFTQVLSKRDLSKARDLFFVRDEAIANDLTEVINAICEIISSPDYANNDNDQSVVEICITRVTSAIREKDSIEQHAESMVMLLESCLNHNLKPSSKGEDPPHAKISSDIISCIFLNYSKKDVMKRVLPVAVKFLHKGNKELSRNMASYLSLAAVHNAHLLSRHIQLIIDSVISGNYPLCRVLPQIYDESKEQIHDHAMALVSLLPSCDLTEKLALLHLFAQIANNMPTLLEASLPQLCEYLGTSSTTAATLQVFLNLADKCPQMLTDSIPKIKNAASCYPNTLCLAAQVLAAVGKLSKDIAQDALNFVLKYLPKVDRGSQGMLLREATQLCSSYPVLCTDKMLAEVWQCSRNKSNETVNKLLSNTERNSPINQTLNGVTIVKVNGERNENKIHSVGSAARPLSAVHHPPSSQNGGFEEPWLNRQEINRVVITPRLRLIGDSRSTGRLHTSAAHRSMTKLNNVSNTKIGSIGGLHKSMTKLSSSQLNCQPPLPPMQPSCQTAQTHTSQLVNNRAITSNGYLHQYSINASSNKIFCGGVTVTTRESSPTKSISGSASALRDDGNITSSSIVRHSTPNYCTVQSSHDSSNYHIVQSDVNQLTNPHQSSTRILNNPSNSPLNQSLILHSINQSSIGSLEATEGIPSPTFIIPRRPNNTTVTFINNNNNKPPAPSVSQRISVFEPYPMRDTIQHFCEKHLDKIKAYMENVSLHIPPPAKCTIEERRAKKLVKLHFACQGRGEHCLYNRTFFTMRTRYPRIWIHLMFLTLQARSSSALSSRHASVTSLKNCWDILKCENRTFLTLVTSAFPCMKDQELLLNELRRSGFCDVFECSGPNVNLWCCFLCNHPERAIGFLQDSQPVIEGQLKEKKGRWKLFKRWKTRYFTLSGAHLSYKESKDDKEVTPIEVHQIRSVKVCRGARNIPKAFEIFTGDQSLILKPKRGKNAEEWVQCLSIVVAHSQAKEIPSRSSSLIRNTV